ncbi:MAG TPA: dethiobiotin synthase [Gammaproteobacteria bacterium]|jgi:dethiobiotin synthetase|nr:dethiobiotin synthase [Gammaproteobacteria bacterium]
MPTKLFIAGTDTDIGKTYVSTGILNFFKKNRFSTLGLKPIASGCYRKNGLLFNSDALQLQNASSIQLHYHQINPFAFEPAISPNIAADLIARELTVHELKQKTQYAIQYPADICLIEGVGGWCVPLNQRETMADFVKATQLKVILVIGIRLGCINHAILTYKTMLSDNISIAGWIGNCIDPMMSARDENIATLKEWIKAPLLGVIDYEGSVENSMQLEPLLLL